MHAVAKTFKVSVPTVARWVKRAGGQRLDRVDFSSRLPGRAWNRTAAMLERRILQCRRWLKDESVLGEYGARAIQQALQSEGVTPPSVATLNRVLSRHGFQDAARRVRRPPPPPGWYLPAVVGGQAELDGFDFIEDLKIAGGPRVDVLTVHSLHGKRTDAWVMEHKNAQDTANALWARFRREGLPAYAQFDNDTIFQGAHQFPDTVGRLSRLCLALGVIPVFVPPLEHGMQNPIESFNSLWQAKVWRRQRVASLAELQAASDRYIAAHRAHHAIPTENAPPRRPFPKRFRLDLNAPVTGTMIFVRRTNDAGQVSLLGRSFLVDTHWPHRLVRCEVDFDRHRIRCYGLRRRAPTEQPLLTTTPYYRHDKPFKGAL
jgi:transposase